MKARSWGKNVWEEKEVLVSAGILGSIKNIQRWYIYFRFLVARALGIYGRRWISEMVFSVIKRRFGDRV